MLHFAGSKWHTLATQPVLDAHGTSITLDEATSAPILSMWRTFVAKHGITITHSSIQNQHITLFIAEHSHDLDKLLASHITSAQMGKNVVQALLNDSMKNISPRNAILASILASGDQPDADEDVQTEEYHFSAPFKSGLSADLVQQRTRSDSIGTASTANTANTNKYDHLAAILRMDVVKNSFYGSPEREESPQVSATVSEQPSPETSISKRLHHSFDAEGEYNDFTTENDRSTLEVLEWSNGLNGFRKAQPTTAPLALTAEGIGGHDFRFLHPLHRPLFPPTTSFVSVSATVSVSSSPHSSPTRPPPTLPTKTIISPARNIPLNSNLPTILESVSGKESFEGPGPGPVSMSDPFDDIMAMSVLEMTMEPEVVVELTRSMDEAQDAPGPVERAIVPGKIPVVIEAIEEISPQEAWLGSVPISDPFEDNRMLGVPALGMGPERVWESVHEALQAPVPAFTAPTILETAQEVSESEPLFGPEPMSDPFEDIRAQRVFDMNMEPEAVLESVNSMDETTNDAQEVQLVPSPSIALPILIETVEEESVYACLPGQDPLDEEEGIMFSTSLPDMAMEPEAVLESVNSIDEAEEVLLSAVPSTLPTISEMIKKGSEIASLPGHDHFEEELMRGFADMTKKPEEMVDSTSAVQVGLSAMPFDKPIITEPVDRVVVEESLLGPVPMDDSFEEKVTLSEPVMTMDTEVEVEVKMVESMSAVAEAPPVPVLVELTSVPSICSPSGHLHTEESTADAHIHTQATVNEEVHAPQHPSPHSIVFPEVSYDTHTLDLAGSALAPATSAAVYTKVEEAEVECDAVSVGSSISTASSCLHSQQPRFVQSGTSVELLRRKLIRKQKSLKQKKAVKHEAQVLAVSATFNHVPVDKCVSSAMESDTSDAESTMVDTQSSVSPCSTTEKDKKTTSWAEEPAPRFPSSPGVTAATPEKTTTRQPRKIHTGLACSVAKFLLPFLLCVILFIGGRWYTKTNPDSIWQSQQRLETPVQRSEGATARRGSAASASYPASSVSASAVRQPFATPVSGSAPRSTGLSSSPVTPTTAPDLEPLLAEDEGTLSLHVSIRGLGHHQFRTETKSPNHHSRTGRASDRTSTSTGDRPSSRRGPGTSPSTSTNTNTNRSTTVVNAPRGSFRYAWARLRGALVTAVRTVTFPVHNLLTGWFRSWQ